MNNEYDLIFDILQFSRILVIKNNIFQLFKNTNIIK